MQTQTHYVQRRNWRFKKGALRGWKLGLLNEEMHMKRRSVVDQGRAIVAYDDDDHDDH